MFEELMEYRRIKANESTAYRAIRLESLQSYPNSFGSSFEEQKQKKKLGFEQYIEKLIPKISLWVLFMSISLLGFVVFIDKELLDVGIEGKSSKCMFSPIIKGMV